MTTLIVVLNLISIALTVSATLLARSHRELAIRAFLVGTAILLCSFLLYLVVLSDREDRSQSKQEPPMRVTDGYMQARQMMDHWGLFQWELRMDMARRRAGLCEYGVKTISLSVNMVKLNPLEEVRKTVLHEIAHALVGPGHGHGDVWMSKAVDVGADPVACYDPAEKIMPVGRWQVLCPGCGRLHSKCRRPSREAYRCHCGEVIRFVDTKEIALC